MVGGRGAGRRSSRHHHAAGGEDGGGGRKSTRFAALAQTKEPTFYIAGNNGSSLVESALLELGWKRITSKYDETFKLKWVECKSSVNYNTLKDEQLVNRIPNCSLLTNKLGLLNSLQRYERVAHSTAICNTNILPLDFIPQTYRIDDPAEKITFFEEFQSGDIWICKPCGLNQGKGIYLVRDLEEFQRNLDERDEKRQRQSQRPMQRIVQKYIAKPLLLSNRKFDLRAYMLIASTSPYLVCYHKGYARLCLCTYRKDSENLVGHLTNQYIQKQDSVYSEYKEETVWSMEKFNEYVNEHLAEKKGVEKDWVFTTLTDQMRQIMGYCFHSVKHKLTNRIGYFDLYGFDFMIDDQMKIWLIEINANPCLATNCKSLEEVLPGIIRESLYLSIECFEKSRRHQPLHPLQCLTNFQIIYDGSSSKQKAQTIAKSYGTTPGQINSTISPRSRCYSPRQKRSSLQLSNPLTQSSPGILSSRGTSAQPPTIKEENIQCTVKAYTRSTTSTVSNTVVSQATPRATSATAVSSKPGSGKVLSLSPATVGLRGALPASPGPVVSANSEVFKFKMTHAALMSSMKMERSKSADKRMLQDIIKAEHAKAENTSSRVNSARSQNGQSERLVLSARESISSSASARKHGSSKLKDNPTYTSQQPDALKEAPKNSEISQHLDHVHRKQYTSVTSQKILQPLKEEHGRDKKLEKDGLEHSKQSERKSASPIRKVPEVQNRERSGGKKSNPPVHIENFKYRLTPSPTAVHIPAQQSTDGTNLQKFMNSSPSIPTLKKDRSATGVTNVCNTDGGIIVGVSIKKNERGS